MVVEFGIMSNKWSVEADEKLTAYATIILYLYTNVKLIVLYNEECKQDQWAFADDIEKRLDEIFGGVSGGFEAYLDSHKDDIRKAYKTIKKLV